MSPITAFFFPAQPTTALHTTHSNNKSIHYHPHVPYLYNVPNQPLTKAHQLDFHHHTQYDEDAGYKLAKSMAPPKTTASTFVDVNKSFYPDPADWEEITYRILPSGRPVAITHTHKSEACYHKGCNFAERWGPQRPTPNQDNCAPLTSSGNGPCTTGGAATLTRVKTITKLAGQAIKKRRRQEKENRAVALWYANAL
jgi:hypothetical protein